MILNNSLILKKDVWGNEYMNAKRKKTEELLLNTFSIIDKSGLNTEKYKEIFKNMSDEDFEKYMKKLKSDSDENFYMEILPYKNEPLLKDIIEAADYLKIPLNEYVYYRNDDYKDNPIRSKYPVPVGYLNMKRMEQMLFKKNNMELDIDRRNSKTNQLTNESKVARMTDAENYLMNIYEADFALKEMLSCRADDNVAKAEMFRDIATQGYCRLTDQTNDVANKQTLNTVDVYFTGAGLVSDLLTPGLMFRRTLDDRHKKDAVKEKFEEDNTEVNKLSEDEAHEMLQELFYRTLQVGADNTLFDKLNEFSVSGVAQVAGGNGVQEPQVTINPYIHPTDDLYAVLNELDDDDMDGEE